MSNQVKTLSNNYNKIPSKLNEFTLLSVYARSVYVYLVSFDNCYPSYSLIAKHSGIRSYSTIKKAIDELIHYNMLQVVSGGLDADGKKSNQYLITHPDSWKNIATSYVARKKRKNIGKKKDQRYIPCSGVATSDVEYKYKYINKKEEEKIKFSSSSSYSASLGSFIESQCPDIASLSNQETNGNATSYVARVDSKTHATSDVAMTREMELRRLMANCTNPRQRLGYQLELVKITKGEK